MLADVGGSACKEAAKLFIAASTTGVRSSSCFLQLDRKRKRTEKNTRTLNLFMSFTFLQSKANKEEFAHYY
jgi:hypothetical protein